MEGKIYCNYCSKRMTKPVCACGRVYCYIRYYYDGVAHFRRKLANGKSLTYDQGGKASTTECAEAILRKIK